jgi:hypothetical protein
VAITCSIAARAPAIVVAERLRSASRASPSAALAASNASRSAEQSSICLRALNCSQCWSICVECRVEGVDCVQVDGIDCVHNLLFRVGMERSRAAPSTQSPLAGRGGPEDLVGPDRQEQSERGGAAFAG